MTTLAQPWTVDERSLPLVLLDGALLRVRDIDAGDFDRLARLFARLSPESRYRRFLSPKRDLTPRELEYLTDVDQFHHVAIAAIDAETGSIMAVARYASHSDREPGSAEIAVEVADELQNLGIGSALASRTVQRARDNGLHRLTATTLWENRAARALLHRLGFRARGSSGGTLEYELELL